MTPFAIDFFPWCRAGQVNNVEMYFCVFRAKCQGTAECAASAAGLRCPVWRQGEIHQCHQGFTHWHASGHRWLHQAGKHRKIRASFSAAARPALADALFSTRMPCHAVLCLARFYGAKLQFQRDAGGHGGGGCRQTDQRVIWTQPCSRALLVQHARLIRRGTLTKVIRLHACMAFVEKGNLTCSCSIFNATCIKHRNSRRSWMRWTLSVQTWAIVRVSAANIAKVNTTGRDLTRQIDYGTRTGLNYAGNLQNLILHIKCVLQHAREMLLVPCIVVWRLKRAIIFVLLG